MTTDNEPLDLIGMLYLAKAHYEETLTAVHIALDQTLGRDHRTRDDSAAAAIRRLAAEAEKRGAVEALEDALAETRAMYVAQQEYASRDHGAGPKAHFRGVTQGVGMARGILADRLASLRQDEHLGEVTHP